MQSKKSKLIFSKTEQNQFEADKLGEGVMGSTTWKSRKWFSYTRKLWVSDIPQCKLHYGKQRMYFQGNYYLIISSILVNITHTHTRLTALFAGLPRWAGTRKVKPIWILLKHETVSGSGISWAICKSASSYRQITTPTPHNSIFYRPDALPATQPTASKHWRLKKLKCHRKNATNKA